MYILKTDMSSPKCKKNAKKMGAGEVFYFEIKVKNGVFEVKKGKIKKYPLFRFLRLHSGYFV